MDNVIYYSVIDENYALKRFNNSERQKDIDGTSVITLKRQKSAVWELLGFAIAEQLNKNIDDVKIFKSASGKWLSNELCFSLSHSEDLVAVAVSSLPVGVDCEKVDGKKREFLLKTLTEKEKKGGFELSDGNLISLWTKKESIFKIEGNGVFNPKSIDTTDKNASSFSVCDGKYVVSVATKEKRTFKLRKIKL